MQMAKRKKPKTVNGRPVKLFENPEIKDKMIEAILMGNSLEVSAQYAGIEVETYYNYMKRGQAGEKGFIDFFNDVTHARYNAEVKLVGTINAHSLEDWRAGAWILERRHPKRWGKIDKETTIVNNVVSVAVIPETAEDEDALFAKFQNVNKKIGDGDVK